MTMKREKKDILKGTQIGSESKKDSGLTGCCGGTATSNETACCKLDEEKKAKGECGCNCYTETDSKSDSRCC